jgi:hypothetical protein
MIKDHAYRDHPAHCCDQFLGMAGRLTTPTNSGSKVHDGPPIPQQPVSPNRIVVTGFGLGAGLLLGSVAAKVRCPTRPGAA